MELKISIATIILCILCIGQARSKEITHEDIKDAMLSLVHMMRDNTEKLERHEARDRQTAEQTKKALSLLTKRMSSVDGLKAYLVKLDERITGVEMLIAQKDERDRIQMQKTTDSLEDLQSRLEGWATEIESKVLESMSRAYSSNTPTSDKSPEILSRIDSTLNKLTHRVDKLLEDVDARLEDITEKFNDQNGLVSVLTEVQGVGNKIKDLSETVKTLGPVNSTSKVSNEQGTTNTEDQTNRLNHLQELLYTTLNEIRDIPRTSILQTMHNETQMSVQEAKHVLKDVVEQRYETIDRKLTENKEESRDSITSLRSDVANNAERINQELQDLGKGQSVMVEMADHVLDTKKRLEHAYKIVREVGELVMAQGLNINNTLNTRFDGISNDIMNNQKGALANLTTKMEQEMNQVWRQINVMHQHIMESAKALDKLHEQNEAYVNGTTSTMDGMESKVGEITKRMSEVDTNLNYLLGRLSLVTQEFNQIKHGLGAALDNIKASFKEVQEKANDLSNNPGPHPVPQDFVTVLP